MQELRTGKCRAAFVKVFEPQIPAAKKDNPDAKPEYSLLLIVPKNSQTATDIKKAIKAEAEECFNGKIPPKMYVPLKDAAEQEWCEGREEFDNSYVINLKSYFKIPVVDKKRQELYDSSDFKSGDYCRVIMRLKAFNKTANKGVGSYLEAIQMLEKGDAFAGADPVQKFDDWVDEDDAGDAEDLTENDLFAV